jgi:hypothetical protein
MDHTKTILEPWRGLSCYAWRDDTVPSLQALLKGWGWSDYVIREVPTWQALYAELEESCDVFGYVAHDGWQLLCCGEAYALRVQQDGLDDFVINWTSIYTPFAYQMDLMLRKSYDVDVRVRCGRLCMLDMPYAAEYGEPWHVRYLRHYPRNSLLETVCSWRLSRDRMPRVVKLPPNLGPSVPEEITIYSSVIDTVAGLGVPADLWPSPPTVPKLLIAR